MDRLARAHGHARDIGAPGAHTVHTGNPELRDGRLGPKGQPTAPDAMLHAIGVYPDNGNRPRGTWYMRLTFTSASTGAAGVEQTRCAPRERQLTSRILLHGKLGATNTGFEPHAGRNFGGHQYPGVGGRDTVSPRQPCWHTR